MSTFATLKARIADDLRRSDLTSQIASAVQDAIKRWEGERFFFNQKRWTLPTVASTEYYDSTDLLETDGSAIGTGETLLELDAMTILITNDQVPMHERSQQWFDRNQETASSYTGEPYYYAIYGDRLRLGPVPNNVYTLTLSGLARLPTLSADDDTNAWTTEAEPLIRHQALCELFRVVLRDAEGFQIANGGVQDAVAMLRQKTNRKLSSRIAPWGA